MKPRKRGRPTSVGIASLVLIHSGPRSINKVKLDDLISILPCIPPNHHDFYKNLQPTTANDSELSESDGETTYSLKIINPKRDLNLWRKI